MCSTARAAGGRAHRDRDHCGHDGDHEAVGEPAHRLAAAPRLLGAALDIWGTDRSTGTALRQTLTTLRDFPHASTEATVEYGLDLLRKLASGAPGEAAATLVAARQQQIRNDATTGQPLTQSGEGALQICAAHKDPVGVRHAAFRSCTDR
ncbi:hypothetical protein ACFQ1L_33820 [Phytohabitans flavus]|uniref:hypothetical protein n=1 Tax=Phytohabitans flavus TaxID=1076124 RepID=UPI00363459CE